MSDNRILWLDLARTMSVIAIVMLHVTLVAFAPYAHDAVQRDAWLWAIDETWAFHLTSLFLISGILSARRIRSGFGAGAGRVVLRPLYLYVVWYLIYVVLTTLGDNTWTPTLSQKKAAIVELLLPRNVLWFLLALALWSALFAAARRVPGWLMLGITLVASIGSWWVPGERGVDQYINILTYGFFLALGVYGRELIMMCVSRHAAWTAGLSLVVFAGSRAVDHDYWSMPVGPLTHPLYLLSAALLLLTACRLLVTIPALRSPTAWSGTRALPVYVLHLPIAGALVLLPGWSQLIEWASARTPIIPATLTAGVIGIALVLYELARRTSVRLLFEPPEALFRHRGQSTDATSGRDPATG